MECTVELAAASCLTTIIIGSVMVGLVNKRTPELAISTWPSDITPATHYSESRSKEQLDESIRPQAHSDYVYQKINTYGHDIDIMIEAKRKEELAVAKYLELHG